MEWPRYRLIRCWDAKLGHEIYRITVGLGGLGGGPELYVWSLLSLRYNWGIVYLFVCLHLAYTDIHGLHMQW